MRLTVAGSRHHDENMTAFTIQVLGSQDSGKTSHIQRMVTGEYTWQPLDEEAVTTFETTQGAIQVTFLEGTEDGEENEKEIDGHIVMFDKKTTDNAEIAQWMELTFQLGPTAVLVGNKVDGQVAADPMLKRIVKGVPYFNMSVKSCYKINEPILHLLRILTKNPHLNFVKQL